MKLLLSRKDQKEKNPNDNGQLAWASWIIARIGGWKGYGSEYSSGPITMLRGLRDFAWLYKCWSLLNEMCV